MTNKSELGVGHGEASSGASTPPNSISHPEPTKPITIMLPDDVLKKLKVIALVREVTVSELLAEVASAVVKRELKKALSKISGE